MEFAKCRPYACLISPFLLPLRVTYTLLIEHGHNDGYEGVSHFRVHLISPLIAATVRSRSMRTSVLEGTYYRSFSRPFGISTEEARKS